MIYGDPMWKWENIYLVADMRKFSVPFWTWKIKMLCGMGHQLMGGFGVPSHKKLNSFLTNWDNLILFKDLWAVDTHPRMGEYMSWWVGGLIGKVMWNH